MTGAIVAISLLAPTEQTMGHAQRIVYVHVAVAWLGLAGILAAAAGGLLYLLRRDLAWDHRAQAAAEVGWVCVEPDPGHRLALGPRGVGKLVDVGPEAHHRVHPLDSVLRLLDGPQRHRRPPSPGPRWRRWWRSSRRSTSRWW